MTVAELIEKLKKLPPDLPVQTYFSKDADLIDADVCAVGHHGYQPGRQAVVIM